MSETNIISPLSLSSESSSSDQQAALRKFSSGSNNSNGSGSFRKSNSTIMYNGPLPSINDGKEYVLENSINSNHTKPKVTELVKTFNHKPLSTIHSVHNEILPPAIEKEKKELQHLNSTSTTKYLSTTFEILDSTINTPLANHNHNHHGSNSTTSISNNNNNNIISINNRNRSGSTGSKPTILPSQPGGILNVVGLSLNTQQPTPISISASSSPPPQSIDDQLCNNNSNNNNTVNINRIQPSNQKPPTTPTVATITKQQQQDSNSLNDLLFNLPTTPTSVPRIGISTVPKKLSSNKLLVPSTGGVPPLSPSSSSIHNNVIPIVQLPSISTTSPSTSLTTTPRLSQPSQSHTLLINQQQQAQLNELNNQITTSPPPSTSTITTTSSATSTGGVIPTTITSSSTPSTSSSSSSSSSSTPNTPLSTTPILLSNNNTRISPIIQRSSTQYIINSNSQPTKDFNSLGNFSNNSGERVKSKQYSMLNISKKTIIDESDLSTSSPRSSNNSNSSPNSMRASISSQLPPNLLVSSTLSGSSPINNKPLVVKKSTSTSEHIKKENIWRQTMVPSNKEDHIKVVFDGIPGKRVIQKFLIDKSPQEIKLKFFEDLANDSSLSLSNSTTTTLLSPDNYELKVLSVNSTITNETLPLRRQMLMQACNISRLFPKLHLVLKQQLPADAAAAAGTPLQKSPSSSTLMMIDNNEVIDVKGHIQAELEIFELIGTSFTRVLDQGQEVVSFRRDFAQFRLSNFTSTRNDLSQMIYVSSEPIPLIIPSKITIMVLLPGDGKIVKRVDCEPQSSVSDVKNAIFKKFAMIDRVHTRDKTVDDFVLKVTGFREYIFAIHELGNLTSRQRFYPTGPKGDFALIDFDYIRQCVGKSQTVELSLVNNSILGLGQVEEKVSFIDKILETSDYDDYDDDEEMDNVSNNSFEDIPSTANNPKIQQHQQQSIITQTRGSFDDSNGSVGESSSSNNNSGGIPSTTNAVGNFLPNNSKLPINIVKRLFRVNIAGLRNLNFNNNEEAKSKFVDNKQPNVFVMAELYYGGELLTNPVYTSITQIASFDGSVEFPNWEKGIAFTIPIRYLPRAARASFTVFVTTVSEALESQMEEIASKSIPIGWSNCLLMNHKGMLRMGPTAFRLWDDGRRANPIGTCVDNQGSKTPIILLVEFESFIRPIVYVDSSVVTVNNNNNGNDDQSPSSPNNNSIPSSPSQPLKKLELEEARRLKQLMDSDPLVQFTLEDKRLIYNYRHIYKSKPKALAKFLLSVNWIDHDQVSEAYRQMNDWALLKPVQALEILDAKFADENVRNFAIKIINSFTDAEFSDFLLQLTQVLKYEPYHNSDLTHILIQRALSNRSRIGHFFFWFLKSEMHTPEIEERYGLLLEGYLRSCGTHRQDLIKQNQVLKSLHSVAMLVKNTHGASERKKVLQEGLSKIKFPETFQLPLDPRWEAKGLIVDKCRYMDSKKLPLWLVFENVEPHAKPLTVIFKVGDDLRQDILTLQVLRIMDKFWKNSGMDLRLQPYKCIATGDGIGMLEVVLNANTIANINKDAGGTGALLEEKTLVNWLKECNQTEAEYNKAVETFILSCAGYVVATYVMGIGDRHSDNIMITKMGHLFHIDYGHFLGNYKKKYGFKRERAPFIFTPQYVAIVNSTGAKDENFKTFVTTCCAAYNILRKNIDLFINLFQLMLSTGIPELQSAEDIEYLRKALAPGLSDEEAAEEFTKNIQVALNTKTVLLNDIFHGWAH